MHQKTTIATALDIAADKARYNSRAKRLFANKAVLAWTIKYCTREFRDYPIEEIMECIEGEPEVSGIPVFPGGTKTAVISGMATVDDVPDEGEVTYDIRFYVIVPSTGERIKMIINLEIQNKYNPGYILSKRGVFYCARMISAQKDTEFTSSDYDSMKKVYSIWVCADSPLYAFNTITSYEMAQNNLYGDFPENSDADLLSVVMVHLKTERDCPLEKLHPLVGLLTVLLTSRLDVKEKIGILEKQYHIKMYEEMKGELIGMCNLADGIEERGIERGLEQGLERGLKALVASLKPFVTDFQSLYQAVIANEEYADLPEAEVRKYFYNNI